PSTCIFRACHSIFLLCPRYKFPLPLATPHWSRHSPLNSPRVSPLPSQICSREIDQPPTTQYVKWLRHFGRDHCWFTPYPRRRGEPIPSAIQEQFMTPDTLEAPDIAGVSPLSQQIGRAHV